MIPAPQCAGYLSETSMRKILAAALAATMLATPVLAAEQGALEAGKPAGVKQASIEAGGVLLWVGTLAAAGAIAPIAPTTLGPSFSPTGTSPYSFCVVFMTARGQPR